MPYLLCTYVSMYLPMYVSMPKHHSSFGHSIKCSLANETMRGQFIGNNLSYVKNVNFVAIFFLLNDQLLVTFSSTAC